MKTVTAAYAKANLGALLERVSLGERIIISRYGQSVAQLAPPEKHKRVRKLGGGKGKVIIHDPNWAAPLTDKEMEEWLK